MEIEIAWNKIVVEETHRKTCVAPVTCINRYERREHQGFVKAEKKKECKIVSSYETNGRKNMRGFIR